jgi:SAM-dependent methyltransferase
MSGARDRVKRLQEMHATSEDPLRWFEALYQEASGDSACIPWADLEANPNLVEWLDERPGYSGTALVVGCGLGDDAEELSRRGYQVTAFDLSKTAIAWCGKRFPGSAVDYRVADLLNLSKDWHSKFDLVLESYTLQVLPKALRPAGIGALAACLAADRELLVITRGRAADEDLPGPPWSLARNEFAPLMDRGLRESLFEDYMDREEPPVRRFRILYSRESAT